MSLSSYLFRCSNLLSRKLFSSKRRTDREDYPSSFFNGMDFRLATYTGGPTYVPDHLGVLRIPGVNRPAVQGMRMATTIADGAVLGPELITNGTIDSGIGWLSSIDGSSFSGGRYIFASSLPTTSSLWQTLSPLNGESFTCTFEVVAITSGSVYIRCGGVSGTPRTVPGTYTEVVTANGTSMSAGVQQSIGAVGVVVDNISIKKHLPTYLNTDKSGNAILPSTPQKTVTYNTDWTAKTFAETFDKFDISNPLKAPGWLCEPVRTNYALNSETPATHTTGTLAVGTYTLWQEGTGSIVATAGTAVGTFGTASNGNPATITITTAGTVVLTASGTNTWVQLELGAFNTSRIYTKTASVARAATIASFPTAGKIPVNNFAVRMIVVPRASGQNGVSCFGSYVDSNNFIAIIVAPTNITIRKRIAGINTDALVLVTHVSGVPLDLILYSSPSLGMQIAVRAFSSLWGAFTDGTANDTTAAKVNTQITSTYQLGALNGSAQFTGNISMFDCVPIPAGIADPMAWAKTHWGVA